MAPDPVPRRRPGAGPPPTPPAGQMKVALVQSGVTLIRFHAASGPDVRGAVARFSRDEDHEIG